MKKGKWEVWYVFKDDKQHGYLVTYTSKKKAKIFAKSLMDNINIIEVQLKKI